MDDTQGGTGRGAVREYAELLGYVLLKLGLVLLMAAMLFLLPVLLPIGLALTWLDTRRKRAVAARTACARCGRILGREALEIADKTWMDEAWGSFDGVPGARLKPRIVRTLDAVCPGCGARYRYDEAARRFDPAPDPMPPTAGPGDGDASPVLRRSGPVDAPHRGPHRTRDATTGRTRCAILPPMPWPWRRRAWPPCPSGPRWRRW